VKLKRKINWAKEQKKWWSKLKKKTKQFFYQRVKRTTNLTKCPENKKNKDQMKQNSISQFEIEWCNWKQFKILQKSEKQKLKIKITRTEVDISINQRTILGFFTSIAVFNVKREKNGRRRKKCYRRCTAWKAWAPSTC
jgi:hypothetical protein